MNDLELSPYQSVGKVYAATVVGKDKSLVVRQTDNYVTAFYIGQPTQKEGEDLRRLLTVAHAFDTKNSLKTKHMVFVPASNANLSDESHKYPILPDKSGGRVVLPNRSQSKCISNDICVLFVSPNSGTGATIDVLPPLQLVVKEDGHYDKTDSWTIIGYPTQSVHLSSMQRVEGKFILSHTLKHYEPLTIQVDNVAALGMSGGPWMLNGSDSHVNGIQSSVVVNNDHTSCNAVSPFFTEELLGKLDLQYTLIQEDDVRK